MFSETGESSEIEGRFKSGKDSNPDVFLARLLQYLETPQYMRKALFPVHSDLKYAGLLNPLDAPHHLRANEDSLYREGIVVDQTVKEGRGSYCNIGLKKPCSIQRLLKPGVRVTVQLDQPEGSSTQRGLLTGKAVAPSAPRKKKGIWWGYNTRLAGGLGEVFSNCPYKGGYDLCIGTSDKGANAQDPAFKLRPFKHLLIVFGGVLGLETCVEGDEHLEATRPEQLFHQYINVCPRQGSRTIRTEEAIQITLSVLDPYILASGK